MLDKPDSVHFVYHFHTDQNEHDKSQQETDQHNRVDDREPVDLKALGEEHLLESVPLGVLHPAEREKEREGKRETERGREREEEGREEGEVYMYQLCLPLALKH